MKSFISSLLFCYLGLIVVHATGMTQQPNVIVIYADDQGSVDANCYGATDLKTPGIDSLAKRGVRFTQFYSPAPVCSASRAGMLTGRYPWLVGFEGNAGGPPREDIENLEEIKGKPAPFAQETTMAEMFKSAGYATGHVGKWHLNVTPGSKPLDQGFDYSFGHMGGCVDNFTHFFYW
ncbi:sulfatase-like hydrolase/transferase, partial [bacterium]|nr:sulfatase-like hydrolase/transferase [bacterium]